MAKAIIDYSKKRYLLYLFIIFHVLSSLILISVTVLTMYRYFNTKKVPNKLNKNKDGAFKWQCFDFTYLGYLVFLFLSCMLLSIFCLKVDKLLDMKIFIPYLHEYQHCLNFSLCKKKNS